MRKPPAGPVPTVPETSAARAGFVKQQRRYELITPLFGGGVQAGTNDPVTIIRGASIRGQLRFWWRACRGGAFNGDLADMKAREDAIWGAPASAQGGGPSPVEIAVQILDEGEEDHPFEVVPHKKNPRKSQLQPQPGIPAYAAFPLQPSDEEIKEGGIGMPTRAVRVGVAFTLTITYPQSILLPDKSSLSLIEEVKAALWAWETFGGIGARTRRGFGALRLTKVDDQPYTDLPPANPQKAQAWLHEKLAQHVKGGTWPDDVPHLGKDMTLSLPPHKRFAGNALKVWEELIKKLQSFRQQRRNKHTGNLDSYGHSDWPEPNALRTKKGRSQRGPHRDRTIETVPRAAFGLPIVFHMPHDTNLDGTLQLDEQNDRYASPLILKPLACQKGAVGLAAILQGTSVPDELYIKGPFRDPTIRRTLSEDHAADIPPLDGNPDVLQAFLDYLNK